MAIREKIESGDAALILDGRLAFTDGSRFRKHLSGLMERGIKRLTFELSKLESMDSAGLGMLLVARSECEKHNIPLRLENPCGEVKNLLQVTGCYERFEIVG